MTMWSASSAIGDGADVRAAGFRAGVLRATVARVAGGRGGAGSFAAGGFALSVLLPALVARFGGSGLAWAGASAGLDGVRFRDSGFFDGTAGAAAGSSGF
jgi:hypothetical protein